IAGGLINRETCDATGWIALPNIKELAAGIDGHDVCAGEARNERRTGGQGQRAGGLVDLIDPNRRKTFTADEKKFACGIGPSAVGGCAAGSIEWATGDRRQKAGGAIDREGLDRGISHRLIEELAVDDGHYISAAGRNGWGCVAGKRQKSSTGKT